MVAIGPSIRSSAGSSDGDVVVGMEIALVQEVDAYLNSRREEVTIPGRASKMRPISSW
jgi:hypothetical protein